MTINQDIIETGIELPTSKSDEATEAESSSSATISKTGGTTILARQPWLVAFYHTTTSVLGAQAVVALPISFAYLGWVGGFLLLLVSAAVSFYSGYLLIGLQEEGQKTYSDIADSIMFPKFSHYFVRPIQLIIFFQVAVLVVLATAEVLLSLQETMGVHQSLSLNWWIVIAGFLIFCIVLTPDIAHMWPLSLLGTITAVVATILLVVGCGISIGNGSNDDVDYDRTPPTNGATNERLQYTFGVLSSFGIIALVYGGHSVLPDVQVSLGCETTAVAKQQMTKGLKAAYWLIVPCYVSICAVGYLAFGSEVSDFVVNDLADYVSSEFLSVLDFVVLINGLALGAIYIQAAFTLIGDIFPRTFRKEGSSDWCRQLTMRFLFLALATFTAVALPFFGQLSALSGAIGFTPLTFVYPFLFWNRKHAKDASPWVLRGNLLVAILYTLLGACGAIGALYSIVVNASTYQLFHHRAGL
jgi:vesicular inhibitory amino acid transporter